MQLPNIFKLTVICARATRGGGRYSALTLAMSMMDVARGRAPSLTGGDVLRKMAMPFSVRCLPAHPRPRRHRVGLLFQIAAITWRGHAKLRRVWLSYMVYLAFVQISV